MVELLHKVEYAGQAIALVLANTQAQADAAALLVTATYTDVVPPILTIADARANPSRGFLAVDMPPLVVGNAKKTAVSASKVVTVCLSQAE